jgi:hypothetical protein
MKNTNKDNCSYNDRLNAEILAIFFKNCQADFVFFLAEIDRHAKYHQVDAATIFTVENLNKRTMPPIADLGHRKCYLRKTAKNMVRDALRKLAVRRKVNERLDSEAQAQAAEQSAVVQLHRDEEQLAQKRLKLKLVGQFLTQHPHRFHLISLCWEHFERTGIKITQKELALKIGKNQSTVSLRLQAEWSQIDKALAAPDIAGMDL